MFWGLIMEPNKRYSQIVEKPFHLSMASLDASTAGNGLVQVMICYDERTYLLCTLQKDNIWQVPLDLNFEEGTKISFTCNGGGHVHLTGFLIPDDEGLDDLDDDEDEDEEEEEDDEEVPTLVDGNKRKALKHSKDENNSKRAKISKDDSIDDEDDDDSDSDVDGMLDSDEIDDSLLEEDNDMSMEDIDEDDDDDDEEDEDEQEEEPEKPSKKEKQNKQKPEQKQNNQQQNQSQNKDKKDKKEKNKDKNKMVNGKQEKPEKEQAKQKKNKNDSKSDDSQVEQQQQQKKRTVEGGVQIQDIKVGTGAPAKSGKFVSVYYVGRLKNGKKFDSTKQGEGFKFRLGKGEVIKGWDIGVAGMKVGGKRLLCIPPNMAYGAKGSPPVIPPNSWLNFEVELKSIH